MQVKLSIDKSGNTKTCLNTVPIICKSMKDIAQITGQKNYSPFIFKNGIRTSANCLSVECIVIDVDGGSTIVEAQKKLSDICHMITTTKSHQLETKNGKPIEKCDRYRIFIFLKQPIIDLDYYGKVIAYLIKEFKGDEACKDTARFYYPNPSQKVYFGSGEEYYDLTKIQINEAKMEQKNNHKKEKVVMSGETPVINSSGIGLPISKWYENLSDKKAEMVHCPISPELHNNNDNNPSCKMTKNGKFINFICFGCGAEGYYREEAKADKDKKAVIPYFDKNAVADIKKGLKNVDDIIEEFIKHLPAGNDIDEVDVLGNILENGIFPLKVYEQTLYIGYEGKWWAVGNREKERLSFVKEAIFKSYNGATRVSSGAIKGVYDEILIEYKKLDNYEAENCVYINLENTVLSIDKNGIRTINNHNLDFGFRWQLPFLYDENATAPLFEQFLKTTIGEEEAIRVLQEFMGYVFLSHSHFNLEKALWLLGSGANGKSVLTATLKYVYGEENISYLDLPEFEDQEKRTMLKGKILNISQDATNKISENSYKTIVSGEKLIARELYKGSIVINNVPKLVIATNDMPKIKSGLDAFVRRTLIIPFNHIIPENERDIHLASKLKGEIAGIFNFAIVGLERLLQKGAFSKSTMIDEAIKNFKGETDFLTDFINENKIEQVSKEDGRYIVQTELYRHLNEWCKTNGVRNTFDSARKLCNEISRKYGFLPYKNNNIYGIRGYWSSDTVNVPSDESEY